MLEYSSKWSRCAEVYRGLNFSGTPPQTIYGQGCEITRRDSEGHIGKHPRHVSITSAVPIWHVIDNLQGFCWRDSTWTCWQTRSTVGKFAKPFEICQKTQAAFMIKPWNV